MRTVEIPHRGMNPQTELQLDGPLPPLFDAIDAVSPLVKSAAGGLYLVADVVVKE